jgi:PAS domain S-box-containing protein
MKIDDEHWDQWLLEGIPAAVFVKDLDGRVQFANQCFEAWYGCPSPDWQGKTVDELWTPEQAERCRALDRSVLVTGCVARAEDEIREPDGSARRILSTKFPLRDADSRIVGIGTLNTSLSDAAGVPSGATIPAETSRAAAGAPQPDRPGDEALRLQDDLRHITGERDLAKAALLDNQRHLNLITRNLPALIVHYDAQLRYQFVNETYCRWRCVEPSDVLGRSIADVTSPDLGTDTRAAFERALAGESVSLEYSDEFPDGRTRDMHGILVPEKLPDDTVVGVFALGTDVSELKQMERALLRQTRLATLGQVTGTLARELRTPLATILISTGALARQHQAERPNLTRPLERIERSVCRCSAIIAGLLDYARTPTLSLEAVDLDGWLDGELSSWALPSSVTLARALESGLTLDVDRRFLAHAIENLRDNALEAMRPGTGQLPRGQLTVSTRLERDRVEIVVADTGRGIPAHAREQVFEPLFSLSMNGVGLGLPLVQQVMQEHGGGADVADSTPEGTSVVLWFPRPASSHGS